MRSALPIAYDPLPGEPVQFLKFLSEAMDGRQPLVDLIQEMIGYLITNDAEQEAVFYFLGKSRGGKGTLIKIIAALSATATSAARHHPGFANQFLGHGL